MAFLLGRVHDTPGACACPVLLRLENLRIFLFHFPVSRVVMDSSHHDFLFLETENRTESVRFRSFSRNLYSHVTGGSANKKNGIPSPSQRRAQCHVLVPLNLTGTINGRPSKS